MYSYSSDEETFYGTYPTIEEAIIEGFDMCGDEQEIIYVGKNTEPKKVSEYLKTHMVERLVESIKEEVFEEAGEGAEDFLNCNNNVIDNLIEKFRKAIDEWADDYVLHPFPHDVINIKSYTREDLRCDDGGLG